MEFGRVPKNRLYKIDFTLPADPLMNKQVLKGAGKIKGRVYYGTGKWGRKEYIGKIYPKGTREAAFLDEYFRHFNSVELNATHYKMYKAADIKKWTGSATKDFRFAPKMYKGVS